MGTTSQPIVSESVAVLNGQGSWEQTLKELYKDRVQKAQELNDVTERIAQIEKHMTLEGMRLPDRG